VEVDNSGYKKDFVAERISVFHFRMFRIITYTIESQFRLQYVHFGGNMEMGQNSTITISNVKHNTNPTLIFVHFSMINRNAKQKKKSTVSSVFHRFSHVINN
jgi:hypothetical protein